MAGKFEIKKSANGKFHFNLKAGNGQIILSSEMYESKSACENGIESIKKNAGNEARFERRETKTGDPYFILKAGNGQEIGRSEVYQGGIAGMENGIKSVMTNAPDATVVDNTAS